MFAKRLLLRGWRNWRLVSVALAAGVLSVMYYMCSCCHVQVAVLAKRLLLRGWRNWRLVSVVLAAGVLSVMYYICLMETPFYLPDQKNTNGLILKALSERMAQEKGTGCEMPELDPFSADAMKFDKPVEKVVCSGLDWVECYLSECFVIDAILTNMKDLECFYEDIIYKNDHNHYLGEPERVLGGDRYVLQRSDQVKVSCAGMAIDSLGILKSRWSGLKAGYRAVRPAAAPPADSPNVFMILLDSTSRNHFIRRMPKSYKVLTEQLKAVVMKRYNIVGDATGNALWPILTGHVDLEVDSDPRQTVDNKRPVDQEPFIFNVLRKRGYRTAYHEDMPWIDTFTYRYNGFDRSPTDHYLRPFFQELDSIRNQIMRLGKPNYCVGSVSKLHFLLNYSSQLFDLDGKKFCVAFSNTFSHDDLNTISMVDHELEYFLRKFQTDGMLNDTMLFVMGDHGPRYVKLRNTYQGKLEERLPFVSVVLPESVKRARPDALRNLRANADVLATPFDVHTTVLDALGLFPLRHQLVVPGADIERGLSFLRPIPASRSCAEAGVLPHWCACARWRDVPAAERMHARAAQALAAFIDTITDEKRKYCVRRNLVSIEWVHRYSPNDKMLGFNSLIHLDLYIGHYERRRHVRPDVEYYQAKITLSPGTAIFEGSMQYILKTDLFVVSEKDISRITEYGDEPSCLNRTHRHLNKYCYCITKLGVT